MRERFQIGAIQQWRLQKLMGIARHKGNRDYSFSGKLIIEH